MGWEACSGKPPGAGRAGDRVVQLRHPPPSTKPSLPPAHCGSSGLAPPHARGKDCWCWERLGGSAAGAFESRAAGGNEKPP